MIDVAPTPLGDCIRNDKGLRGLFDESTRRDLEQAAERMERHVEVARHRPVTRDRGSGRVQ